MGIQESKEFLYFKVPVFIIDLIIHLLSMYWLLDWAPDSMVLDIEQADAELGIYCLVAVSFSISISIFSLRLQERKIDPMRVIARAAAQTIITNIVLIVLMAMVYKAVPRHIFSYQLLLTMPSIAIWHFIANRIVRQLRHLGFNTRHVVIVGGNESALNIYNELIEGQGFTGYKVMGFFSSLTEVQLPKEANLLGSINDSYEWIKREKPDEVYCSLPPSDFPTENSKIISLCNDNFINFFFVPTMDGYPRRSMVISRMGSVNLIRLHEEPLESPFAKMYKRGFDIIVSLLFLILVYPWVFLFVAIGTKITSPGPIYFRQKRTGYNGKAFYIYKFRSMKVNADSDKLQATKDDPRKTKFGDFLRRSSIDELPQFINVFKGDMSVIGPRPHMEYHTDMYNKLIGDYMVRHLAKPGITGWAQVNGCRGETHTVEEMKNRVEHDIWYIENWNPILDLEIFFRTIFQCFLGKDKQAY